MEINEQLMYNIIVKEEIIRFVITNKLKIFSYRAYLSRSMELIVLI